MSNEYHVVYSLRYYPRFHVTTVGLGTYYPWIRGPDVYSSFKAPVVLVRFWWNMNPLDRFLKNTQMLNFMKTLPVGAELLHVSGRTDRHTHTHSQIDMTKPMVAFVIFRTPLKVVVYSLHSLRSSVLLYKLAGLNYLHQNYHRSVFG